MLTSTQIPDDQNDLPADAPLLLIPEESLSQLLHLYEISPEPSSFDSGHEVRNIPIFIALVNANIDIDSRSTTTSKMAVRGDTMSRSVTPTQLSRLG